MVERISFALQSALGAIAFLMLFAISSEEWDGACGHKQEFGLFPFYRAGSGSGTAAECASGVLMTGVLYTLVASVVIVGFLIWSWRKYLGSADDEIS